jgi:small subunit ribosomal protein S6
MNNYEVLYIIESSLDEAAREAAISKYESVITAGGGVVSSIDKWGIRKFAYPINYKNDGFYVLMTFSSSPEMPKELERQMRISDEVIRYMVIRK